MGSCTEELTKSPLVSVIVPAYNEQENIVPCTMAVRSALRKARLDFEMLRAVIGNTELPFSDFLPARDSRMNHERGADFKVKRKSFEKFRQRYLDGAR